MKIYFFMTKICFCELACVSHLKFKMAARHGARRTNFSGALYIKGKRRSRFNLAKIFTKNPRPKFIHFKKCHFTCFAASVLFCKTSIIIERYKAVTRNCSANRNSINWVAAKFKKCFLFSRILFPVLHVNFGKKPFYIESGVIIAKIWIKDQPERLDPLAKILLHVWLSLVLLSRFYACLVCLVFSVESNLLDYIFIQIVR